LEAQGLPPMVKNRAIQSARSGIASAIEAASKGWDPLGLAARKGGEVATQMMKDAADKIVDQLKPVIAKVVGIVKEKMKKKAEEKKGDEGKEVEEKDKKQEIGDIVSEWKFQLTPIGKNLYKGLTSSAPAEAIKSSSEEIMGRLTEAVRKPIMGAVDKLCEARYAIDSWTQWQIWWLARRVCDFICAITTLDGFLEAAGKLGASVSTLEGEYVAAAGKKEELEKLADKASSALWQTLAAEAVGLWTKIWKLSDKVNEVFSGQPDEVKEPLLELLSHIFEVQVRGFNAIRVLYTRKLKETLSSCGDGDSVKEASRTALRDAIFEVVNLLAIEHWTKTHEALTEAAKAYVIYRFENEIWPDIKTGLDALTSMLPETVTKAGLDIAGMAFKVASILINKGVEWAMKKVGIKLEEAIFKQDEGEGYGS